MHTLEEWQAIEWLNGLPEDTKGQVIDLAIERKKETHELLPTCIAWVKENRGYEIEACLEART
jgi:hypothetical protein